MSTIKVNKIENTATASGGIAIDASGHVTVDGQQLPTTGALTSRNLVVNGGMQVSQRGTQATGVTSVGYRTCDRFKFDVSSLGTWTVDQSTDSPNGFSNSFKLTCTTADSSPSANDYAIVMHMVEAQNLQHLGFGTSDALPLTLTFHVKSNKTGNATFSILQHDNSSKQATFQYSISSANTWEKKTISIPADTAGVINNDNGIGFQMQWWINSGSTFTGGSHQATWTTFANGNENPSNLGVGGATSDTFAITGVQLEVGEKATPFEHRSYGDELARCQRYFQDYSGEDTYGANTGVDASYANIKFLPVVMRTAPTVAFTWASGSGASIVAEGAAAIRQSGLHSPANAFTTALTLTAEL